MEGSRPVADQAPNGPIAVQAGCGRWMVLSDVPSVRDSHPPYPHARPRPAHGRRPQPDRDRDRGHVRHDGRDRPLAGRTSRAQRSTSQMTADSLGLERLMVDLETGVRGYMLTDDARFLEPYRTARTQLDDRLDGLAAVAPPSLRPRIDRITRDVDAYVRDYTEPLIIDHSGNVLAATTEGKRRLDGLRAAVRRAQQRAGGDHRWSPRQVAGPAPPHARAGRRRRRALRAAAGRARPRPAPRRAAARPPRRPCRRAPGQGQARHARPGQRLRRDRPARRLVQPDGRGAQPRASAT